MKYFVNPSKENALMVENIMKGVKNRILQFFARNCPGATTLRVTFNRWRGVKIGTGVWIGYDSIIDTAYPELISIGNDASIGIRCTIIAHYWYWEQGDIPKVNQKDFLSVCIEDKAFIGPGVIILPNVTIGYGSVVAAGSVVSQSIPPMTYARGNPAKPIATCGVTLSGGRTLKEFIHKLKPFKKNKSKNNIENHSKI